MALAVPVVLIVLVTVLVVGGIGYLIDGTSGD